MTRFLIGLWIIALGSAAQAACDGTDLRPTLTPAERAEVRMTVDAAPFTRGNHWTATRFGEILHLVGTVHLDDPRLDAPTATLAPIVKDAAMLLVEITAAEEQQLQARMAEDPSLIMLPDTTLPELMDDAAWQALSDAVTERGLPPFMAAKFQPWYLSILLALPPCMTALTETGQGLDKRLQAIATDAGVPIRSLEPADTMFSSFAETPIADQLEMLNTALATAETGEDQFATLLATYFEEAHYESWITSRVLARRDAPVSGGQMDAAFDELEAALLTTRNAAWIGVLQDALKSTEGIVVAAFGAAHLGGKEGILALLREEGFILIRQPF